MVAATEVGSVRLKLGQAAALRILTMHLQVQCSRKDIFFVRAVRTQYYELNCWTIAALTHSNFEVAPRTDPESGLVRCRIYHQVHQVRVQSPS